jgi:hypothetical protein
VTTSAGTVAKTSGTVARTVEIARKIGGIVVRIDGTAVKIAMTRAAATGMRLSTIDATIAVMVRAGWAEMIASTAARTIVTTADATTAPPA